MRDLTDFLQEWPYDPNSHVRKLAAADGREVLQVRTPLGVEQYELEGRPDGARPYGCESALEHVKSERDRHVREAGSASGFTLDRAAAVELQQEGLLFYYRYLVCFQIGEYQVVIDDTARNLEMFDIVAAHCIDEDARHSSEQYRPYVMRMNAAARALLAVGDAQYNVARRVVREAVAAISDLPDVPTETFEYEKKRSLAILRGMVRAIPDATPPTREELLNKELRDAILEENYERAAALRDELKSLGLQVRPSVHQSGPAISGDA